MVRGSHSGSRSDFRALDISCDYLRPHILPIHAETTMPRKMIQTQGEKLSPFGIYVFAGCHLKLIDDHHFGRDGDITYTHRGTSEA